MCYAAIVVISLEMVVLSVLYGFAAHTHTHTHTYIYIYIYIYIYNNLAIFVINEDLYLADLQNCVLQWILSEHVGFEIS